MGHFDPQSGLWMGCEKELPHLEVPDKGSGEDNAKDETDGEGGSILAWKARTSIPVNTATAETSSDCNEKGKEKGSGPK